MSNRTFDEFMRSVKYSVEECAERKGYITEGSNPLAAFTQGIGIHDAHAIGEIIYKAREYLKATPATKKILAEKIAGWCYRLWITLD